MKYILLLLPFFINAQIINIQGSVNSNDGPLGFATVSILDTSYGVTSNENGYFEIQVDSSKDNYLLVSYLGYISKKISLKNIDKDFRYQYTSKGVHKDDILFLIDEYSIKKYGSQGQQKTFLIALKLAQFDYLSRLSKNPILLLDDIFDKLDDDRVEKIIDLVNEDNFKQIFISDTNKKRSEEIIKKVNKSYKIFEI